MHPHSKINKIIWLVIAIAVIALGYFFFKNKEVADPMDKVNIVEDVIPKGKSGMSLYENYLYSFKFEYPENLYMKESEATDPNKSQFSLVLVEGTKENIELIEGRFEGAGREGPTTITLNVYNNAKKLTGEQWAKQDGNWNIGSKQISIATAGGLQGVAYTWSGLYEGERVIITKGGEVYVFTVTWITPEDQILKDFDMILKSFVFVE